MSAILHVTQTGHRCHNPLKTPPASYIKAGEALGLGTWELYYHKGTYIVQSVNQPLGGHWYEFTNFNCAAAKLAELGA